MAGSVPTLITTFITYYPDDRFRSQLQELLANEIKVVVYDNTPGKDDDLFAMQSPGLLVLGDGQNLGLGKGLRGLMQFVQQQTYTHALYFDQDTIISARTISWIKNWLIRGTDKMAAFAGVQFTSAYFGVSEEDSPVEQQLLINSGTLFDLQKLDKLGGHDASLFVECVDYKFCLDAAYHGFKLGLVTVCPDIDHQTLQPIRKLKLGGYLIEHRYYPWKRHVQFIKTLLKLANIARGRGQWNYVYIFLRNVCTHLIAQAIKRLLSRFLRPS